MVMQCITDRIYGIYGSCIRMHPIWSLHDTCLEYFGDCCLRMFAKIWPGHEGVVCFLFVGPVLGCRYKKSSVESFKLPSQWVMRFYMISILWRLISKCKVGMASKQHGLTWAFKFKPFASACYAHDFCLHLPIPRRRLEKARQTRQSGWFNMVWYANLSDLWVWTLDFGHLWIAVVDLEPGVSPQMGIPKTGGL